MTERKKFTTSDNIRHPELGSGSINVNEKKLILSIKSFKDLYINRQKNCKSWIAAHSLAMTKNADFYKKRPMY